VVTGTETGGSKWLEVTADETDVLALLSQFPQFNAGDGRFVVAYGPTVFNCDDTTYREALTLAGQSTWEAGNPSGHRAARNASDPSAREW